MTYSFRTTLKKAIKYGIAFALPMAINAFVVAYPEWAQLTLGAALIALLDFLKNYVGVRIP